MARKGNSRGIPAYALYGDAPRRIAGPMLHIETIEARSTRHQWKIGAHRHHRLHQLIFVVQGHGVVLADGRRSQYRPPAILVTPAGTVHGFEFEPGTQGHVLSLSIELVADLAARAPGINALFLQAATFEVRADDLDATDLAHSFGMLAREFARPPSADGLALHGWLEVVLGNLLRLASVMPHPSDVVAGKRQQLMARFSELVEQRFRQNPSVADLARALHVSGSHLRSVCLAATGQSPIQLIHARILLEAKRQLHYTGSPVSEIGYALGFDDPAYFTRFFSRLTGQSPRAFRHREPGRAAARL